jgi:hypothetical protein
MTTKIWCCLGLAIAFLLSLIIYLLYIIFKVMASLITTYGAFLIFLCMTMCICRYVIRILVFPGSCIFIRKVIEYNNRKYMTRIIINTLCNLRYVLEDTSQTPKVTYDSAEMIVDEAAQTKKMIDTFMTNYNRQNQLGSLTSDQEAFHHKIEDLKQSVASIRLLKSTEKMINISLWD